MLQDFEKLYELLSEMGIHFLLKPVNTPWLTEDDIESINKGLQEFEATNSQMRNKRSNFRRNIMNNITNKQIIALFPSKAEREYLTKINWQFSERDREILYRYLALNEEPAYEGDYVTIPFPFRSGDLVYVIGDEKRIGVFCSCKDDKDFFELDARTKDFSDWTDLNALEIASELIRSTNSSIECLQMYCKEYARKKKRL